MKAKTTRYFTRFSIKIHLEDSVYSLDDDCIELKIECHFVVRYFHKTNLKTGVEPDFQQFESPEILEKV